LFIIAFDVLWFTYGLWLVLAATDLFMWRNKKTSGGVLADATSTLLTT
jgi:hypothetical protein